MRKNNNTYRALWETVKAFHKLNEGFHYSAVAEFFDSKLDQFNSEKDSNDSEDLNKDYHC